MRLTFTNFPGLQQFASEWLMSSSLQKRQKYFSNDKAPVFFLPCLGKRKCLLILLGLTTFFLTGCVQRRMLIRSQPEGAFVSVDRQGIGHSPVSVPFTYYGTREIQLEKDGFKTVRVEQDIRPPWYATFPISLISENFAGREIRDERVMDFSMEPKQSIDHRQLLERANDLRGNIQRGTVTAPLR